MGLLPLVVDKLRQDSKLHDANMSKSTFGTKNVPAYSQFMFQYVYYCKQVYFQQEQSKLSGEIVFFSNLKKRVFRADSRLVFLKLFFLIITCFVMKTLTLSIFSVLAYSVVSCQFSLSHSRLKGASLFLLPLLKLIG